MKIGKNDYDRLDTTNTTCGLSLEVSQPSG